MFDLDIARPSTALLALALPLLAAAPAAAASSDPVNVILILMDDVGIDHVGVYMEGFLDTEAVGDTLPCTPRIDALADMGVRFTNAWSSPSCTPTRSQIMTGRPASWSGMGANVNPAIPNNLGLDEHMFTIARLVDDDAAVGKWHMCDESQEPWHPLAIGFASYAGPLYNLSPNEDGPRYTNWQKWSGDCFPVRTTRYATAVTTDDAIARIDEFEQTAAGPWFLYVAYNASHSPFHCPPPSDCLGEETCGLCEACVPGSPILDDFRAMTQVLDQSIGRIVDRVDLSTTAIILLGDNGTDEQLIRLPFRGAKRTLYQGGLNVPLIIWHPDKPSSFVPAKSNALVVVTDMLATVADFLGVSHEDDPALDSYSLRRYVVPGEYTGPEREYAFSEQFTPTFRPLPDGSPPPEYVTQLHNRAIRNARYKLIEYRTGYAQSPEYELYRLYDPALGPVPQDPADLDNGGNDVISEFEKVNIYQDPIEYPGEAETAFNELRAMLDGPRYPPLPLGWVKYITAGRVEEASLADTVACREDTVHVGTFDDESGPRTGRAFLEFDVSSLFNLITAQDKIRAVWLDLAVWEGGADSATVLDVRPMNGDVSQYDSDCASLYVSPDLSAPPYASLGRWVHQTDFCPPLVKSFPLHGVEEALFDAIQKDRTFSVALTLDAETSPDRVRIFGVGDFDDADMSELRVYYEPRGGNAPPDAAASVPVSPPGPGLTHPNPFVPGSVIRYTLEANAHVQLRVYDVEGRLVRTLVDEDQGANTHAIVWDGRDEEGRPAASGTYFYRFVAGDRVETRKLLLVR